MRKSLLLLIIPLSLFGQKPNSDMIIRWKQQAGNVTIVRDTWGIPHIYGKSDADAVFGLMYAQCEDDFKRVEMNYIEKLGRLSEVKGKQELYNDLLIRMLIDSSDAIKDYERAPSWLRKLSNAFADGINFYLYSHPEVRPALLHKFQPWYPFLWTDGSIGAINTANLGAGDLEKLYTGNSIALNEKEQEDPDEDPTGSNGFAFSPSITESGNAILYINPHVTFYFRPEVHMVSNEGLNVYGAVTWGQFFVYQGFNEHCGWMHTSSAVDAADAYIEKVEPSSKGFTYEYRGEKKPVEVKKITIFYKDINGITTSAFGAMYTQHGPILAKRNGQYLSVRADNRLLSGLEQCWLRNKAKSFSDFKKTLALIGNISNNTVYADAEGNIAYWHGNRIPKRDPAFDWNNPVDGTIAATDWQGYHSINEIVQSINPSNGWLQNCNSTPYTVAGPESPKRSNYPAYMAPDGENFRGINAVRVLSEGKKYNLEKVIKAGYDTRLAAFEVLAPALVNAFEKNIRYEDSLYALLVGPVAVLKNWDYRCNENSVATTLAIEWGQKLSSVIQRTSMEEGYGSLDQVDKSKQFAATAPADKFLTTLLAAVNELEKRYGRWQIPWGRINRFQRISGDIDNKFDDTKASIPVGFASSTWGMLPSYTSQLYPGTNKRYGVNGNSFICAVEFGKRIKAKSLLAGGESGDTDSKHFFDQGLMYSKGQFKDVLFYKEDVLKNKEKVYHPGE